MKLIVTEKDSAAKKIAEILGGKVAVKEHGRGRQKVRSYHFTYDGDDAVAVGLRGHVMETVFPNTYKRWSLKYLGDMIERPDLAWVVDGGAAGTLAALRTVAKGATELVIATDYDREGELIGHEAHRDPARRRAQAQSGRQAGEEEAQGRRRQGRRRGARQGAGAGAGQRRRPARQAHAAGGRGRPAHPRALLGAHAGGGQGRVRQAVHRRLQPRRGGALAAGHRPHLGRGAHPLHVARVVSVRVRLPVRGAGAVADPAPGRRPRARAPGVRAGARTGRSRPRSSTTASRSRWRTPRAASTRRRPWRPRCDGARVETAEVTGLQGRAAPGQAAGAVQHHGAHERRLRRRHDPGARHARRRVAVPRRSHQLPAHRQHGLPAVARPARQPARARAAGSRSPPRRPGSPGRTSSRRRAARSAPPTTRRSTRSALRRRS